MLVALLFSWLPLTLIYLERSGGPFEIFARAQSVQYFDKLKHAFDVQSKGDFELLLEAINNGTLFGLPSEFGFFTPELSKLISFESLATLP